MNNNPSISPIPSQAAAAGASKGASVAAATVAATAGGAVLGVGGAYVVDELNAEEAADVEVAEIKPVNDETVEAARTETVPSPTIDTPVAEAVPAAVDTPPAQAQPAVHEQPVSNAPVEQPVTPSAESQSVASNEPIKIDDLEDVDPMLLADELADVELIDTNAANDPRFFNPTEVYQATNINGQQESVVAAQLPTGEQVFLVDSNQDGAFERVTDVNGNVLANGDDLVATTVDDAIAVLNNDGGYVGGGEMADNTPVMGDVDEIVSDGNMPVDYTAQVPLYDSETIPADDFTIDPTDIIEA